MHSDARDAQDIQLMIKINAEARSSGRISRAKLQEPHLSAARQEGMCLQRQPPYGEPPAARHTAVGVVIQ